MSKDLDDTFMHYCNGTWVDGYVLDCPVETHNVHLASEHPPHHGRIGDRQSRLAGKGS